MADAEMRALPVALTDAEVEASALELARVSMDETGAELALATHKAETKQITDQLKKAVEAVRGHRQALAVKVTSRTEDRDVECAWHFDFDKSYKYLVRTDTNEAVQRQRLDETEKQLKLHGSRREADDAQLALWAEQIEALPPIVDEATPPTGPDAPPPVYYYEGSVMQGKSVALRYTSPKKAPEELAGIALVEGGDGKFKGVTDYGKLVYSADEALLAAYRKALLGAREALPAPQPVADLGELDEPDDESDGDAEEQE
jgi:hypothetical protein